MNVTAYIASNDVNGIEGSLSPINHSGPSSITQDNGEIEIPLLPRNIDENAYFVNIYLHGSTSVAPEYCRISDILSFDLNYYSFGYEYRINGITITFLNPDSGIWERTNVIFDFGRTSIVSIPTSGNGECVDNKDDALTNEGYHESTGTAIFPGEMVTLYWKYLGKISQLITGLYIYSQCLTSGEIIAIRIPYYDIKIEGTIYYNIIASDFYNYQIGDTVFVLKPGVGLDNYNIPSKGSTYANYESATRSGVIVPIGISGIGV